MIQGFTEKELLDIYRWAEKALRGSTYDPEVKRAKRIQAKVSHAIARTPTGMVAGGDRFDVPVGRSPGASAQAASP